MQRVTSRQRLFSWDQFDAAAHSDSDSSSSYEEEDTESEEATDTQSEYETCVSMSRHASLNFFKNSQSFDNDFDNEHDEHDEHEIDDTPIGLGLEELSNECDCDVVLDQSLLVELHLQIHQQQQQQQQLQHQQQQNQQLRKRDVHGMKKSISFSNLVLEDPHDRSSLDPPVLFSESSPSPCINTTRTSTAMLEKPQLLPATTVPVPTPVRVPDTVTDCPLTSLHLDMQLSIFGYLDLTSLRALKRSCSQLYNLFTQHQEEDALKTSIWCPLMQQQWPPLSHTTTLSSTTTFHVRTKHTTKNSGGATGTGTSSGISSVPYATVLTHASPIPLMTHMMCHDPTLFSKYDMECTTTTSTTQEPVSVVQFVGTTGLGDQSLVSNEPFPLPLRSLPLDPKSNLSRSPSLEDIAEFEHGTTSKRSKSATTSTNTTTLTSPATMFKRWRRGNCTKRGCTVDAVYESIHQSFISKFGLNNPCLPFVSPFVSRINEVDLTPRRMAYFEVSILPRQEAHELTTNDIDSDRLEVLRLEERQTPPLDSTNRSTECVAVGLSLPGYATVGRMPGWDSLSYGYHGDDGGLFHSKGDMLRKFGPTYGAGDTVGCGIQYDTGGIFFTKNGEFLGYAWTKVPIVLEGTTKLYPTVGVDSLCPIVCNFGTTRPFLFDFAGFVGTQGSLPLDNKP